MKTSDTDSIEETRRAWAVQINSQPAERAALAARYGPVWNPDALTKDFIVLAFGAPLVVVRRRVDNQLGSLLFQHQPRYYFAFKEDK